MIRPAKHCRLPLYSALGYVPPESSPERTVLITPKERVPVIVSSAVMRDDAGTATGAVFLIHDITQYPRN